MTIAGNHSRRGFPGDLGPLAEIWIQGITPCSPLGHQGPPTQKWTTYHENEISGRYGIPKRGSKVVPELEFSTGHCPQPHIFSRIKYLNL